MTTPPSLIQPRRSIARLALLFTLLTCLMASSLLAQSRSGGRSSRGGHKMSAGEKREFNSLAAKGLAWAATRHQNTNSVDPEKVANFFGLEAFRTANFRLRAGQTKTNENLYAQAGMAFLSALNDDQMTILRDGVAAQMKALNRFTETHGKIVDHLSRARVHHADHQTELLRMMTSNGRLQGAIGLTQARLMRELTVSMGKQQMEYFADFRRGVTSDPFVAYGAGAAAQLTGMLDELPPKHLAQLLETSEETFNWITGSLAGNFAFDGADIADVLAETTATPGPLPTTGIAKKPAMKKYDKGKGPSALNGVAGILDWRQHRLVRGLMQQEKPLFASYISNRGQLVSELYRLRTSESVNAGKIEALAVNMGKTEGKILLMQAQTFAYLESNLRPEQLQRLTAASKSNPTPRSLTSTTR
ncbi:MAG: hypothetical protein ACKVJX_02030 [Verrucomicrobiia bacterium]|jgi:hypothetical protein